MSINGNFSCVRSMVFGVNILGTSSRRVAPSHAPKKARVEREPVTKVRREAKRKGFKRHDPDTSNVAADFPARMAKNIQ